jgi:hypothetical protein
MAELPTLAQGTMPSFTPPAEDRDSASSLLRGALGDQFSGIGNLMDRKAKADEEAMRLEQQQKQTELEKKAGAYKTYAEDIKGQYEQAKPALTAAAPKFNVSKDTEEGLTGLAALMTVGSLIVGSKGATSGVNAMNAMTGVLKGYQEGNQQRIDFETKKYEQSIRDWERNLQQTKDALSRYEKMAALDLNKATAEAAAYAASQGQDVIAAKIRSGTIGDAIKMVQNLQQQNMTVTSQMRQAMLEASGGVGARGALATMFGPQVAANTPEKQAEKLVGSINSIKSTMDLVKKAQDPEIKFGELGTIGTKIEAAFRRNLGSDNSELSGAAVSRSIDEAANESGLNPNDKNVVFYKEAVFTALELERQARGGSILPVAVMKTLTPLLDPRTTTKEAYIEILRRRAQDVARSTGLTQEQLDSAISRSPNVSISIPGAEPAASKIVNVNSEAEAEALPKGTRFNLRGRTGVVE